MRPRRLAAALGVLAAIGGPLAAATFEPGSLVYIPAHYSAGDEVVARGRLAPERDERLSPLSLAPGAGLPAQGPESDPELRGLELREAREGWVLTLRFVPWSPGSGAAAAPKVKGMRLPPFPYSAASTLGPEDRDPSPPRPQRALPGTSLFLYGLAGALVALALAVLAAVAFLAPAARALLARRRAARALRRLERGLDYLERNAEAAPPAAWFAALSRELRLYLAARALPEAPFLTSGELRSLPDEDFPAPGTGGRAAGLIALADLARFGGRAPAREALVAAAEEARAIARANEEALDARL